MTLIDTTKMNYIERNVHGENVVRKRAFHNIKRIIPQLDNFLDKKIRKADGSRTKAFQIEIPKHKDTRERIELNGGTVTLIQDAIVPVSNIPGGGHTVNYYTKYIELGVISKDGYLIGVYSADKVIDENKLQFTVNYDSIKKQIERLEELEDLVSSLRSEVGQYKRIS